MNNWNGLDFFILLIFAVNTILGMARGATKELVSTMCLSIALIFAIKFTIPLTNFFDKSPLITDVIDSPITQNFMEAIGAGPLTASLLKEISYSISLLICFFGAFSVCEGALSLTGFTEFFSFPYAALNRKLGGVLGFARGYIFNIVLVIILSLHLLKDNHVINTDLISQSFFVGILKPAAQRFDSLIYGQQPERYREILQEKPAYNVEDLYKDIRNVPNESQVLPAPKGPGGPPQ